MNPRSVQLQQLHPGDWSRVQPLVKAFYRHFGYTYADRKQGRALRELLADARCGAAWLILEGEKACGYVVLTHGWSIEYGGRVSVVDELFVLPECRGRGIGGHVLQLLHRAARRLGVRRFFLEVESYNRRAKTLYTRTGFTDTRRTLMRMDVKR